MFDRFSDSARKVMALARKEAQRLNHDFIGTEHILLGLVEARGGVATAVLKDLGVEAATVRAEVEKRVKPGSNMVIVGQIPFMPMAKKVLEYSMDEANSLGDSHIGTEHLLLGLLREPEGMAGRVLADLGVKADRVRTEVLELLHDEGPALREEPPPEVAWSHRAVEVARAEAHRRGHGFVGLGHLLLGLLADDGPAAKVLKDLGVTIETIEPLLAKLVEYDLAAVRSRALPLLPLARRAIQRARYEANVLRHDEVGSEHVLLGLLGEPDGAASRLLRELGLDLEEVRRQALGAASPRGRENLPRPGKI
jgi:ATP-dependent Clp protease ATP-binding subunit ClpA